MIGLFHLSSCKKEIIKTEFSIIPTPTKLEIKRGVFEIPTEIKINNPGYKDFDFALDYASSKFKNFNNIKLKVNKNYKKCDIQISKSDNIKLGDEGYSIDISNSKIKITANSSKAIFYAFNTIFSMLEDGTNKLKSEKELRLQAVSITDIPRFKYRGMHLDVCRHFMPIEFIKKYIDFIARYKMNSFHWHLTEDQGWRIEIKKYPKLTEIGAWRDKTIIGHSSKSNEYKNEKHGGFYTQAQIKEIIKYAETKFITVIPEIELPGHSLAALAAYPELGCTKENYKVSPTWGIFEDVYCAGQEYTFTFLEDVLSEVIELFPSKYIHIGGDECPKSAWKKCPKCQNRIKTENLKNEHELQSYFIRRIEKYINSKGKQIIGWDEILEGGLAPNATVMSWRGVKGGIIAAKQYHDVIMTPNSISYLDHYQGDRSTEPLAIGGYTTVKEIYEFNPIPKELSSEEMKHIIGFQGNVWTEYMPNPEHVEYMVFPRICAIAETAWRGENKQDYLSFTKSLNTEIKRLKKLNINIGKFNPEK